MVKTEDFEFVRSFPVVAKKIDRIDVYRFRLPVAEIEEVEIPFMILGPDVKLKVQPVATR